MWFESTWIEANRPGSVIITKTNVGTGELYFLSLDFGLVGDESLKSDQRLAKYRQFVYEVGEIKTEKGKSLAPHIVAREAGKGFLPTGSVRFLSRTRYFTDSGIIGSKEFVRQLWVKLKADDDNPDKQPVPVSGLAGMFSLKRLNELS